jgi:flagellar P-ring protein precursor FlgI
MRRVALLLLILGNVGYGQRIKDIATVAGLRYVHLKGIGMVAGLNGTGDSSKNIELQERMQQILELGDTGLRQLASKNIALVLVTATVPSYTKVGHSFTVHVASIGDAKDLSGGELLEVALSGPITPSTDGDSDETETNYYAVAQGKVSVAANAKVKTSGTSSAILEQEFNIPFVTNNENITLLLNQPDFHTASRVAYVINNCGLFGKPRAPLARAVDAGSIEVRVPLMYLQRKPGTDRIVDFTSIVLSQIPLSPGDIDRKAKVVIDKRTETIVVNGEVKVRAFSAIVDGLVIRIPPANAASLDLAAAHLPLIDVIAEFRKQNLTPADIIQVLKGMAQAGVLEGILEEK